MKKTMLLVLAMTSAFVTANAALKVEKNSVQSNSMKIMITSSDVSFLSISGKDRFCKMVLYTGTKAGWYLPQSKAAKTKFNNAEKNVWKTQTEFPADKKGAKMVTEQIVKLNPNNTFDISCTWGTQDMNNLIETFFWIWLDMKQINGQKIYVNDKPVTVENITKYGWFRGKFDKVRLNFFKGDPKREFSLLCGKCNLVFESLKGQNMSVRLYPISKNDGKIQVTVIIPDKK